MTTIQKLGIPTKLYKIGVFLVMGLPSRKWNCSSRIKLKLLVLTSKTSKSKIWFDRVVQLEITDNLRLKSQNRFFKSSVTKNDVFAAPWTISPILVVSSYI